MMGALGFEVMLGALTTTGSLLALQNSRASCAARR